MTTIKRIHSGNPSSDNNLELRRGRRLVFAAIFILLMALITAGALGYVYTNLGIKNWQIVVNIAAVAPYLLAVLAVFWCVRKRKITLGASILIAAIWIEMVILSLTIVELGQLLGLFVFIFTIGVGIFTMPQRSVSLLVIVGVLARFILEISTQFTQNWQLFIYDFRAVDTIGSVFLLVAFGSLILWQFRALSLTNKLVLIFVYLTLMSTLAINYVNSVSISETLTDNIGQSLNSQAEAQSRVIGDLVQQELTSIRALASNPVLRNMVDRANQGYIGDDVSILADIVRLDEEWRNAVSTGVVTGTLITSRLDNDAAGRLNEFRLLSQDNREVFVTDVYGAIVGSTGITSDYAQADEEWWQGAYNEGWGAVYVGPPTYDESVQEYIIQIAAPVVHPNTGKLIGILRTSFSIDSLIAALGEIRMGETGEVDIVFPGTVNWHVHDRALEIMESQDIGSAQLVKDIPYGQIFFGGADSVASRVQVQSTVDDLFIQSLGWYVVAHQSTEEALAPVIAQQRANRLLAAVIMVIVSLGAIGMSVVITGPVFRLTEVANQIRSGDLSARARVDSEDEVGTLAETFNQMTFQLSEILAGLEQRVSERTREMTLSAEVSRTLSQVRDLDQLLNQAVELIQFSFDLYYTQVYLVDPLGRALVLRAGTGEVGAELLRRQHRLAVGPGSINGLAAFEQHPILVSNTETSPIFRSNPLLPNTRSELSVPLRVGERVVGVLDMQSARSEALSEENLAAFETLAGQLAIAIDNAGLIAQAEKARVEVERQASRLSAEGWREYLDAIQRSERLGYTFDGETLQPGTMMLQPKTLDMSDGAKSVLTMPVTVLGHPLGQIFVERESENKWSQSERELVETVAGQVARQIENLRLLAQAEQYRLEAEEAARRLTREGWRGYFETVLQEKELSFTYDGLLVQETLTEEVGSVLADATKPESVAEKATYVQPLKVREVTIGDLVLEGELVEEDDRRLVEFVAERLAEHLENLRLASQTDLALASTEALYAGSEAIVRSNTVDGVLLAIINASALEQFDQARVMIFDVPWIDKMPAAAVVAGTWERDGSDPEMQVGVMVQMAEKRFVTMLQRGEPFYVPDIQDAANIDDQSRNILAEEGRSVALFPLVAADQWIGWLEVIASSPVYLTEAQLRQAQSLVGQAAAVVQGIRLLQQSEALARREQTLRQMSERLRSAVDPEQVLRTAAKEVGQVLGRTVLIRLGGSQTDENPK